MYEYIVSGCDDGREKAGVVRFRNHNLFRAFGIGLVPVQVCSQQQQVFIGFVEQIDYFACVEYFVVDSFFFDGVGGDAAVLFIEQEQSF